MHTPLETASAFARDELRPVALQYDETRGVPASSCCTGRPRSGSPATTCPRSTAAAGSTRLAERCAVIEELSWGDSPIVWVIAQGGFFAGPILALGSPEQKERWLPPLCGPEPPACAVAITEPGARLRLGGDRDARRVASTAATCSTATRSSSATRRSPTSASSSRPSSPARRSHGHHRVRRRARRRRLRPRRAPAEDGQPLLPGGRAPLRGVLRARRPPARRRGRGLQRSDARVRRRARAARRIDARHRPRGPRARGRRTRGSARRSASRSTSSRRSRSDSPTRS